MTEPLNPRGICRVALVRSNHRLGNNLLLLPLLATLEEVFPGAEIDVITGGTAPSLLFEGYRQVSAVRSFPARSYASPISVLRLLTEIGGEHYDLAIDPVPRSRSGRFLMGVLRARNRVGYRWNEYRADAALTHAVPVDGMPCHMAHMGVHLLRSVLPETRGVTIDPPLMDLRLTESELERGRAQLSRLASEGVGRMIGLYGAASGRKAYGREWWSGFVRRFRALEPDARLVEFVPHDGRPRLGGDIPVYFSSRPRELAAACRAVDLFVTADCGVMHLASAARTRVLGLFKVTDASRYAPYGNGSAAMLAEDAAPTVAAEHASGLLRDACRRSTAAS